MSDDVLYLKLFESTLNELGNLFANELLTLFSSVSGYRILPSIPVLIQGSAEKIKEPLEQLLVKADKEGFMVKARFNFDDHVTRGKFFLFPDDLNIVKGII